MLEIGERPWGKYFVLQDEPNFNPNHAVEIF